MTVTRVPRDPIAIVGVSALFPGSTDAEGFWSDILAGRDTVTDVPPSHWLIEDYYDPDPSAPDKTYAKRGAFLPKVAFEPMAFGVPPSIVPATDTSQLLGLIVAQRVLEDATAGQFDQLDRDRVSVILGVTSGQELLASMVSRLQRPVWVKALREAGIHEDEVQTICNRIADHYVPWQESSFPGLLGNVVAGRIANRLDLGGTNCVTDAACASAFSAVSMALNELDTGQSDMVITGGVDTLNDIFMYMCFSKTPALSPTGDCRPFSDEADGTLLGEGLGMVALKRLADAERDGDRVYALIRGLGSSSDGRAKSVYAPRPEGQARALERAYASAGYSPASVELLEAHGTATKAGDVAEFEGLRLAFSKSGRAEAQWCALGSVKSQIGHTKAASGAAGLFKAVMALHHKVLPPTIKVERPNAKLALADSPFYLNTQTRPWVRPSGHPRRAGVSSFGFGGSNFHITLEEYVGDKPAPRIRTSDSELVVFAAPSPEALLETLRGIDATSRGTLARLARDTQERYADTLAASQARLSIVARDDDDLRDKLATAMALIEANPGDDASHPGGIEYGTGPEVDSSQVALLFPGQGSQYLGMGAALAQTYADAMAAWEVAASVDLGDAPRIDQVVFPRPAFSAAEVDEQRAMLTRTEWAQPAIGASSLAFLRMLRAMGLEAGSVAGHSFGEVAALHAAGVFDEATMLRIARTRGELMAAAASTPGAMIAVDAAREELDVLLQKHGVDVVVANHNAPRQVVLSGSLDAVAAFEQVLTRAGLSAQRLPVATAFHSAIVADSCEPFASALSAHSMQAPRVPVYGNASAATYPSEPAAVATTLAEQIKRPVRFVEQIEAMARAGARVFIEVGPGSVLTSLVGRILADRPHSAVALDRKGQPGLRAWHLALAKLAARGVRFDPARSWASFRKPADPSTAAKPKMTIELTGSNYGKPYPPPEGAAALPPANYDNPTTHREMNVKDATTTPRGASDNGVSHTAHLAHSGSNGASRGIPSAQPASASPPVSQAAPTAAATPVSSAWLYAYQEAQRQTAEAHTAFQNAMAQAHIAFLQTAERNIAGLTAMATGSQLSASALPVASYVPQALSAPPSMPVVHAPVVQAPIAQAPVAQAPVAQAPVAQAPVVQAPVAQAAAAAPAEAGLDAEALLLQVVADKTGYPPDMLEMSMALEADLGIDSIKRVEILAAIMKLRPDLPKVDTKAMASLNTLGEIVGYINNHLASSGVSSKAATPAPKASSAATP